MLTASPTNTPVCYDYRLLTKLGEGGMGEVHLAVQRKTGRRCAVKFIRADRAGDQMAIDRFHAEYQTLRNLDHPYAVKVLDEGLTEDRRPYYAMEFLPGLALDDIVNRFGPLAPERVASLLRQLCSVLHEVHRLALVHRDVKPANLIASDHDDALDAVTLFDFGLATSSDGELACAGGDSQSSFAGSPHYAPPEAARGSEAVDCRSDIYSLGATAYHLLTGQPVFPGNDPVSVIIAHAEQPPTPPSVLDAGIPRVLEAIVMKCLQKRPDDRFQSMAELDDALGRTGLAEQWTSERARRWWTTHRQPALPLSAGMATAATCVSLGDTK